MNNIEQSFGCDTSPEEAFMPLRQMENMIAQCLLKGGRIDIDGKVQPLEVERYEYDRDRWFFRGPQVESVWRHDVVVPEDATEEPQIEELPDGTKIENKIRWTLRSKLYAALTGSDTIVNFDQTTGMQHLRDRQELEARMERSSKYQMILSDTQLKDAYHIHEVAEQEQDSAQTRIYVPAGGNATSVILKMLDQGADFSFVKAWVPQIATGEQKLRSDTPIFGVRTYDQLESTLLALRTLQRGGALPQIEPGLVGMPIEGFSGGYIGQNAPTGSFNGRMEDLLTGPIQTACRELPVSAGERLDEEWFTSVATKARALALNNVEQTNTHPNNHALLAGQDETAFRQAVAAQ